eukprot:g27627.t1
MEDREHGELNSDILKSVHITEEEVRDVLKRINPWDMIMCTLELWEARIVIARPLAEAFASSIATGEVPEDWRLANMVPLFKKGDKEKPGNYRLVSLTLVVGRLLEGILRDRIYMYLERQGVIRDSQRGFVRGKSCLTNLIEFFEEVTKRTDEGRMVDVIYMNFSKAFNKLLMVGWSARLDHMEYRENSWIQNWLEGRRQRVVVDAGCRPMISGVPQGLVMGPVLFVIYINDLDVNIGGMVSKFADDTKIGGVVNSEEGYLRVQRDLDQMGQWAEEWQMEFNLD